MAKEMPFKKMPKGAKPSAAPKPAPKMYSSGGAVTRGTGAAIKGKKYNSGVC